MEEVLIISKKMVGLGDLVIVPIAKPSITGKKRIEAGRQEIKKGECLTLKELRNALGN